MRRIDAISLAGTAALFPAIARAQGVPKVRIGYSPAGESLAQGIYAQEGGFFAKAGIDVEMVPVTNGGAMTAGIVGGSIDIGPSNVASIVPPTPARSAAQSSSRPASSFRRAHHRRRSSRWPQRLAAAHRQRFCRQDDRLQYLARSAASCGDDLARQERRRFEVRVVHRAAQSRSAAGAGGEAHRRRLSRRTVHLFGESVGKERYALHRAALRQPRQSDHDLRLDRQQGVVRREADAGEERASRRALRDSARWANASKPATAALIEAGTRR